MIEKATFETASTLSVCLPISERVLDKLADILFASDEILGMIHVEERRLSETTVVVEESIQSVYDQVNELMKRLSD